MVAAIAKSITGGSMLVFNEPMAKHTTWKVGGFASCFFQPKDVADLADFMGSLSPKEPLLWLGLGSNLLVRDGGFKGTVISTKGRLNGIELADETDCGSAPVHPVPMWPDTQPAWVCVVQRSSPVSREPWVGRWR